MNQQDRISRRNEIENVLLLKLNAIIDKIKLNDITDTNIAQSLFNSEVNSVIRAGVQVSYELASQYVTDKVKKDSFLTTADLEIIKEQVEQYTLKFWRKVDMILHRNDVLSQKYNYEPRSPLNSNYMASVLAIGIVTTTMAKATISKVAQIKQDRTKSGAFGLKRFFALADIFGGKGSQYGVPRDEFEDQVQWNAILDNRTCMYCLSLHGAYFYYNDPHKPIPGDDLDIHPNCRCMYDYLPSILDIPLAIQLAKLTRQTQFAVGDELGLGTVGTKSLP